MTDRTGAAARNVSSPLARANGSLELSVLGLSLLALLVISTGGSGI
jgi:hypothetical protein